MRRTPLTMLGTPRLGERLTEASLNRVWSHYSDTGFAILTSWRPDSGEFAEVSRKQNKARFKKLKSDIQKAGFGFIPIHGVWKEQSEPSLFVPAKRKASKGKAGDRMTLRGVAIRLGGVYNQDAVIWSPGEKVQLIATALDGREGKPGDVVMRWDKFVPSVVGMAYSRIERGRKAKHPHQTSRKAKGFKFDVKAAGQVMGKPRAISADTDFAWYFNHPPVSYMEALIRESQGEIL